jgi:hypothetical protein
MATNYPGALDVLTNPASTDRLTTPSHAEQHANVNDAVEAIQATLGVNPQGASATVSDRQERISVWSAPVLANTFDFALALTSPERIRRTINGSATIGSTTHEQGAVVDATITNTSGGTVLLSFVPAWRWATGEAPPTDLAAGATLLLSLVVTRDTANADAVDAAWVVTGAL